MDNGDGQGNCNGVRTQAALALADWLASDPTGSNDPDVLIIGDLNAYAQEDPITALKGRGYTNLIETFGGIEAYSYAFDGQWGYLDHALASASLISQVSGVSEWHNNAGEPNVLDYNTNFKSAGQIAALFAPDAYRTSDHDPVIIGLNLTSATPIAVPGDVNRDGVVDLNDLNLVTAARNTPASGPDDPRDVDGDGQITVLDARKLVLLCTLPRCATPAP